MKFVVFCAVFITVSKSMPTSLLTGTYDPNSTALINDRRDFKEIDVLRQIINQETLIRLAVVKNVMAVVDDVDSVKQNIASAKTIMTTLQQTVYMLKSQVDSLIQDNTLAQNVETLKEQVDSITQDQTAETLKKQIDNLSQENKKTALICHDRIEDIDQIVKTMKENISDIYEYLTTGTGLKQDKDCMDLYLKGHTHSGIYRIHPFGNESQTQVQCDMVNKVGGWTVIQKRRSGFVNFNKTWMEYKKGFGNVKDSYWIGNDAIHQLTMGRNSSLYVSITLQNGTTLYELYRQFSISDEANKYRLFLGGPVTGTLGDMMLNTGFSYADLSEAYFSTSDRDNDMWPYNCAVSYGGGWWFNRCHNAFLNGPWSPESWTNPWYPRVTTGTSLRETMMLIKPQ